MPNTDKVRCDACGYTGAVGTYLPAISLHADCLCPRCGSTDNQHNAKYADRLRKAWNCKHEGTLVAGGTTTGGEPTLHCTECGSYGLAWSMRGEPRPDHHE